MSRSPQVVAVTGAGRGLGRATALALATRGDTVVATGRDEAALVALTACTGGSHLVADVRDPGAGQSLVDHAVSTHGRLDAVIANAGVGHAGSFTAMDPARITELVEVDLLAPLLLARAAAPVLPVGGAIVLVTSIAGVLGVPDEAVYSAVKAGLEMFATVLREELRPAGITVSTVVPGVVATDFFATRGADYDRQIPRPMSPERAAAVVVRALEPGSTRLVVPRWLAVPARLSALAPATYRRLSRRFG